MKHLLLRPPAPSPPSSSSQSQSQLPRPLPPHHQASIHAADATSTSRANSSLPLSSASSVYFVSVQPCFDKKLEASRRDFYDSEEELQEV